MPEARGLLGLTSFPLSSGLELMCVAAPTYQIAVAHWDFAGHTWGATEREDAGASASGFQGAQQGGGRGLAGGKGAS